MDEHELPSAYKVAQGGGGVPRWYPLRFGRYRLDSRGYRISFGRREDAEAFCRNEQAEYVRAYPHGEKGGAAGLAPSSEG